MAKLTIKIDDEMLTRARLRAAEQGTSVSAVVRAHLEQYAGSQGAQERALQKLLSLSRTAKSRRGTRASTRGELHER